MQNVLMVLAHWTGLVVAGASGFILLLRGFYGQPLEKMSPMVLPLLAGIAIMDSHWSVIISLGVVVLALIGKELYRIKHEQ